MQKVLVASSKGGAGKTTLATNLAASFANSGGKVTYLDADHQGSGSSWCQKRVDYVHPVLPIDGTKRNALKLVPHDSDYVVIDGPAGSTLAELTPFIDEVDAVLVPVVPSVIDLEATVNFLNALVQHPRIKKGKLKVALVGNRFKPWTNASQQVAEQLEAWPYPLVATLRDSQAYVLMASLGKSVFDYQSEQIRGHQADWAPLLSWLKKV